MDATVIIHKEADDNNDHNLNKNWEEIEDFNFWHVTENEHKGNDNRHCFRIK